MTQELKEALQLISEKCKQAEKPTFYQQMEKQSLSNRIASIKATFLMYVDTVTLNYHKTQYYKKNPDALMEYDEHTVVDLTTKERENAIQEMRWFLKDIQECITHLENK